jgi:hypothetical protein
MTMAKPPDMWDRIIQETDRQQKIQSTPEYKLSQRRLRIQASFWFGFVTITTIPFAYYKWPMGALLALWGVVPFSRVMRFLSY